MIQHVVLMVVTYKRCSWANKSELEIHYHDNEWGIPVHDDLRLFEMLNLEGQQAGLSWQVILNKRKELNEAYLNFDPSKLIELDKSYFEKLYNDDRVIKNKLKINAVYTNALAYFKIVEKYESLDKYLWSFSNNKVINNNINDESEVLNQSDLSIELSKDLKKHGFKFVGPTTIYSFMQAVGMINDHVNHCFKK